MGGDAFDQRVFQALVDFPATPLFGFGFFDAAVTLVLVGNGQQGVGTVWRAVEDDVFHTIAQFCRYLVVDLQLPGVDDTHAQAVADRIQQKHRVNRLAYRIVATERERYVGHATGGQGVGQVVANIGAGVDEIDGVVVVLFDTGGNGEDVRVKNDVFRREADIVDQDVVGALADFSLALLGVGLAVFIERHHHHGGAIAFAQFGVMDELLHAFLHADGVDDTLALNALEAGFDHFPFGGVDHDRNAGNVRFASNQIEEGDHRLLRIEHALVHVDVDHLSAGFDLLQGDFKGFGVVVFTDQPGKTRRTSDVGALANVDEQRTAINGERFQAGQATGFRDVRNSSRRVLAHRIGDGLDVRRRGPTAATDDIEKATLGELFDDCRCLCWLFVVFTKGVRQTGVRVRRNVSAGLVRQLFQVRTQIAGAQRAVQAHRNGFGVADRVPERFSGLSGQCAARGIGNGPGDHDRQFKADFFEHALHGENCGLGIEGVEDRLDQDQIGAALDQAVSGFGVVFHQLIEGHVAVTGVVHVWRQRAGAAGRAENAGNEARLVGCFKGFSVSDLAGEAGTFYVQLIGQRFHAVIGLGNLGGVEGVGFENVRTSVQIGLFDGPNHVRTTENQQVVVAFDITWPVGEAFATVVLFLQPVALDHCAHATIENQNALFEGLLESVEASAAVGHRTTWKGQYRRSEIIANLRAFSERRAFS